MPKAKSSWVWKYFKEEHVDKLCTINGAKTFRKTAKDVMGHRWSAQFDFDATRAIHFCSPARVHKDEPVEHVMATVKWICDAGVKLFDMKEKNHPTDGDGKSISRSVLEASCAAFAAKDGLYAELNYSYEFASFWNTATLIDPYLPFVIRALLQVSPSEACVERVFRMQKDIHTPDRNRLARDTLEAIMFVGVNYGLMLGTVEDVHKHIEL